jgi:hypothetical protein
MSPFMVDAIENVVRTEGPVHIGTLHERLRIAWDIGRIGARIRENIDKAIWRSNMVRDGDFVMTPELHADLQAVTVRTPTQDCQRDIGKVHDKELTEALVRLTQDAGGISQDDLTAGVAKIYGWNRRGSDISARLDSLIGELLKSGQLTGTAGNLRCPPSEVQTQTDRYDRN